MLNCYCTVLSFHHNVVLFPSHCFRMSSSFMTVYLSLSIKIAVLLKAYVLLSLRLPKYCFILMLQSTDNIFLFYWLMRSFQNITCSTIREISMIRLFGASYFVVFHLCLLPTCSCPLSTGKDFFLHWRILSWLFSLWKVFRCGQKKGGITFAGI